VSSLFQRLKERKLVQWAVAYLAGAWVLYEVVDTVGDRWGLPNVFFQGLSVVLAIGFLITLVFAWYHGEQGRQRIGGVELLLVTGLLLVAGGVLSILPSGEEETQPALDLRGARLDDTRPSIAVLPLVNRSGQEEDASFTVGFYWAVYQKLHLISGLRVTDQHSALRFRDSEYTVREIAQALGVRYLLGGGLIRGTDTVRLSVWLSDARTEESIWIESYDRSLSDDNLLAVTSEIAEEVAGELEAALTPEEAARIQDPGTQSVTAYDLYQAGHQRFINRSAENLRAAIGLFELAIEQDSTFALAWAGLATAWVALPWHDPAYPEDAYDRARAAAQRALELDGDLAEAYTALGGIEIYHDWAWETAERHLLRAVELNPNDAQAYHFLALAQGILGQGDQAIESLRAGIRLNPLGNNFRYTLANILYDYGRFDEALEEYRIGESLEPPWVGGLSCLSMFLYQQGEQEEALSVIRRIGALMGLPEPESLEVVLRAFVNLS
jgi:serine/threonine-protein kinase